MKINPPTNLKAIQFLGSPFRGKHWEELKKKQQQPQEKQPLSVEKK